MLQDAKEQEEGGFVVQWRRKHFKSGWANIKKETWKWNYRISYTFVLPKSGPPYPLAS